MFKTRDCLLGRGWAVGMLLGVCAAAVTAGAARADILYESHTFSMVVNNVSWNNTYPENLDLVLFDTQGGTRQLVAYELDSGPLGLAWNLVVHDNPTPNYVGDFAHWSYAWHQDLFPLGANHGTLSGSAGKEVARAPYSTGYTASTLTGGVSFSQQVSDDPNVLNWLTGSGTGTLPCVFTLGPLVEEPATHAPGGTLFDPNIMDEVPLYLHLDGTLTYAYEMVPEPATAGLLALAAFLVLRRR